MQDGYILSLLCKWSSNTRIWDFGTECVHASKHIPAYQWLMFFTISEVQKNPLQTCPSQHMASLLYSPVVIQHLIFNADSACLNNDCPSLFLFYCHSLFFGQPVLSVFLLSLFSLSHPSLLIPF